MADQNINSTAFDSDSEIKNANVWMPDSRIESVTSSVRHDKTKMVHFGRIAGDWQSFFGF